MTKKILLLVLAIIVVISGIAISIIIVCSNHKNTEKNKDTTEEGTTEQAKETTEEITLPPETSAPETSMPEATAPPASESAPVTDTPSLPANTGEHKSANFGNVLFIGDSRTVGLKDYANLGAADIFAENGLNVFRLFKDAVDVPGRGHVSLDCLLRAKQYDKVYLMLGINEIGYNLDKVIELFGKALNTIQEYQPNTTIYIQANLMIQKSRSERDSVYNNTNMRYLNDHMASFADGKKRIFIDVNPLFGDGAGNLAPQYAYDDFHLIGSYYTVWADWIYETTCGR